MNTKTEPTEEQKHRAKLRIQTGEILARWELGELEASDMECSDGTDGGWHRSSDPGVWNFLRLAKTPEQIAIEARGIENKRVMEACGVDHPERAECACAREDGTLAGWYRNGNWIGVNRPESFAFRIKPESVEPVLVPYSYDDVLVGMVVQGKDGRGRAIILGQGAELVDIIWRGIRYEILLADWLQVIVKEDGTIETRPMGRVVG